MVGPNPWRRLDPLILCPDYRFFAPHPGVYDYHLLVRTRGPDGVNSAWREAPIHASRRWFNFVWNPYRRERKASFDLALEFGQRHLDEVAGLEPPPAEETFAYLHMLQYVARDVAGRGVNAFQFLVLVIDPSVAEADRRSQVLYLSPFHDVGA